MGKVTIYYDRAHNRLVYDGVPADEDFWDERWSSGLTAGDIRQPQRVYDTITRRFLPQGARVLDAGCGLARSVYGLQQAGFDAYGVDYAPNTVAAVNRLAPELKVQLADVRDLPFPDGFFGGVWSPGVIEHFREGFERIADEQARVTKRGGLAFVSVPAMSPLRQAKARLGGYPELSGDPPDFYQYAYDKRAVVEGFRRVGFELVATISRAGFIGLKQEAGPLQPLFQRLYDSKARPLRAIRAGLDALLSPLTCHSRVYVFRKL